VPTMTPAAIVAVGLAWWAVVRPARRSALVENRMVSVFLR
jgi:hypothetical protein